jgi:hypothetical protein
LFVVHVARRLPANHSIIDACDAVELGSRTMGWRKARSDYWIQLVTKPQPFGGRRWKLSTKKSR